MICKHCGATLEVILTGNGSLLADVVSGDDGGTYDYCPDNPVGTEDERLHEAIKHDTRHGPWLLRYWPS